MTYVVYTLYACISKVCSTNRTEVRWQCWWYILEPEHSIWNLLYWVVVTFTSQDKLHILRERNNNNHCYLSIARALLSSSLSCHRLLPESSVRSLSSPPFTQTTDLNHTCKIDVIYFWQAYTHIHIHDTHTREHIFNAPNQNNFHIYQNHPKDLNRFDQYDFLLLLLLFKASSIFPRARACVCNVYCIWRKMKTIHFIIQKRAQYFSNWNVPQYFLKQTYKREE